ncbi:cobalamin-dependent protein [Methylobacterium currus]|uniref:B12-binding domain-containing radical SAM protein n=1 Tax=Methylobacterium currus TaxID=2051553 RepID=UPI001E625987|nr:cobalamin-dependent protein [Methylobacterium currus]UHC15737.1 cobalamin-dependent protein [Methylobacterium currus]
MATLSLGKSKSPRFSSAPSREPLRYMGEPSKLVSRSGQARREAGEKPRILLFVPPYTRLIEPSPSGSALAEIGISNFEVMKRAGTPIGLLRIATAAQRAGYEVQVIDSPFFGWDQEADDVQVDKGHLIRYGLDYSQIKNLIDNFSPDIVGIQCNYTVQWGNARILADLIKHLDRDTVVVGGGAHCSGDWENALSDSAMDVIVINEADKTFPFLLNSLTAPDGSVEAVPGIAYRDARCELVRTTKKSNYMSILPNKQDLQSRLDMMPLPDFALLNMNYYLQRYHSSGARVRSHGAWAQIFATIGCNVNCNFCYIPKINGPWRALGLDWFDLHLADLVRHGVTEVLIEDDHLMHDPLYALEVAKLLKKYDLPWVEEGGISLFNLVVLHKGPGFVAAMSENDQRSPIYKNVIEAMKQGLTAKGFIKSLAESGCYNVYLAVESANEESLSNSHKSTFNSIQTATFEIVKLFTDAGIQVTGGFMLGFINPPGKQSGKPYIESLSQIDHTIDYAVDLMNAGMAYANPFIVTPIPGTPMWEFQQDYVVRHYDNGWSHEKATMSCEKWDAEDIERKRLELLVRANGPARVREMVSRGTWPVDGA